MSRHTGHLSLAPNWSDQLKVELLLEEESIRLYAGATLIGDWDMSDVDVEYVEDRIHLFVEGEHLVISTEGASQAAADRQKTITRAARWEDVPPTEEPDTEKTPPRGAHRADDRMRWKW